ncbi:MAG TPA: hypothetical protein PKK95_01720 [Vicinamibacterales bacterium]|nr:hypothetical protein [Acidobacteriota bacterium]HOC16950.1 hypothetical protein [Vicinamibacterales bacterium]
MARRNWIPIVVGIVIFVAIVGIGLIAGAIYLFSRQVEFQTVETAHGEQEFRKLQAGFEGQTPFIELTGDGEFDEARAVVHRELAKGTTGEVSTVHIRVWSPEEGKLISLDLPFWMVRLMGSKPINFETGEGGFNRVSLRVTPEELERRGPGLIMNHTAPRGESVLVWLE